VTGKPCRVLKSKWTTEFDASGLQALPMPHQGLISMPILQGARVAKRADIYPGIAGQSVGMLHAIRPAREVLEAMIAEAIEILGERLPRGVSFHA
jgi:NAD(P)H-dependent flavin oxidoreductase YrpB (nitropropane dioxygenase family)